MSAPIAPTKYPLPPPKPWKMSTSTKALIGLLIAGMTGVLVFMFVHFSSSSPIGSAKASAACVKGKESNCLPEVNYVDTNGVAYTPQSLAGKVVVVNFWATWCKPCMKEIPDLSKVYAQYKGDVVMLGVLSSDNPDNASLLNFQSDNEMSYPVIRENSDILMSYDYPRNLPTTFVFDRSGHQVYNHVGALRAEKLVELIEPLVAQKN